MTTPERRPRSRRGGSVATLQAKGSLHRQLGAIAVGVMLAGCNDDSASDRATATTASATPTTVTTAVATTVAPSITLPPARNPSCPPIPERRQPRSDRPRYDLDLDVRPEERLVEGTVDVRFTPDLDTDRLVFRLWPNGPRQRSEGASIETGPVELDGEPAPSTLRDATKLVVDAGRTLAAGREVRATLAFTLRLPAHVRDRISADGDAVRLGSFFPILEWEPGAGWTDDPPTTQFAEAGTAPTADFDLTVTVPPGLDVLASGTLDGPNHWTANEMRDVAVAVGRFTTATAVAHAPDPVQVTVGVHAGMAEPPELYLGRAVAVLEDFGARFGPYPWPTLTISVTPTLRSGIEYPTHLMHGAGTSGRSLAHEVGHQWFYGLVGNNQGRDPWVDEGLATWAEARAQNNLGSFLGRAIPAEVRGRVDEAMAFWDPRSSSYYAGVYVQGAQALGALGDPDLVDCALRVFVAQNAYGIARPADLVAAASAVFPDAANTLAGFGVRP